LGCGYPALVVNQNIFFIKNRLRRKFPFDKNPTNVCLVYIVMTKKADKIKEIHGVVTRLFAQKGYHNSSMREIARCKKGSHPFIFFITCRAFLLTMNVLSDTHNKQN